MLLLLYWLGKFFLIFLTVFVLKANNSSTSLFEKFGSSKYFSLANFTLTKFSDFECPLAIEFKGSHQKKNRENFGIFPNLNCPPPPPHRIIRTFLIFRTFWKSLTPPIGPISEHFDFFWKYLGSNLCFYALLNPLFMKFRLFWKFGTPPRFSKFRICNSDFFDFGASPSPLRKSSQIFPIFFFEGFPYMNEFKRGILLATILSEIETTF